MQQNDRQLPDRSIDSGGVLDDSYVYDGNGNVAAISDGLSAHRGDRDMTYDGLNRLLTTTSPMFAGGTLYTYDVLDNLKRVKAPGRDHTYSYDAKWRLETVNNTSGGEAVIGLGYDERGNLANKNGQLFVFDTGNRLRTATGLETYLYDGHGRRVKATHPTLGSIYSFYGQDGALRFQHDERQGKATDYIMLNGSLIARVSNVVSPAVPVASAPSYVTTGSYPVSWTAITGASRYEMQEHKDSGSWTQVYSGTALSKAISGKTSGVYGYQVRACNPSACGAWSAEVSVSVTLPPTAVSTITLPATALNGNYTVAWTASAGATSYTLQEKVGSGSWTTAYTGAALSKAYTGKATGSYSYQVRGCNDAGCTAYSAIKTVQSILPPAAKPTLTVPANSTTGSYTASWTAVATATSYTLEEQIGSGAWTAFGANTGTSQALGSRATGTYHYRVKGCNAAGCGPVSTTGTTVILTVPTSAPTLTVPATNTTGSYTVSWTTVATATSYQIQESANGGAWTALYTGAATSKAVSGKTSGSYRYQGWACNATGCGAYSAIKTIAVTAIPVTPGFTDSLKRIWYRSGPGGSTLTHIQCSASWAAVAGAATYELKAGTADGPGDMQYVGPATAVEGAYNTATYCASTQVLRACNSTGCSAWSSSHTQRVVYMNDPPPPGGPGGPPLIMEPGQPTGQDPQGEGP